MICLLIVFVLNTMGQTAILNSDRTNFIDINKDNANEFTEKNDNFIKDINIIVEELKFMYDLDQSIREYTIFKTFDKCITDSIENLSQEKQREYIVANKFKSDNLSKQIYEKYIYPIDETNTKRLIELIDKYGFPSLSRIKKHYECQLDKEFNPYILIVHAPVKYWDELKQIIKKEREIGNLNRCEYGHILWHLNGRKNIQDMLDNGFTLVRDENGLETLKAIDCE